MARKNRKRTNIRWYPESPVILPDEKLVAFRISERRYNVLKSMAEKQGKPITVLINETLDKKLKLEFAALRAERFAAIRSQQQKDNSLG